MYLPSFDICNLSVTVFEVQEQATAESTIIINKNLEVAFDKFLRAVE